MKPTSNKRKKPFAANLASRKKLEREGWVVDDVERSFRFGKVAFKRDAFGFGDLICCNPRMGIMLVQATADASTGNGAKRIAKIKAEARAGVWLASGGRIQVHSWQGKGKDRECFVYNIVKE